MPRQTCIHCSSPLVPNPHQTHWSHCPVCDPLWADHAQEQHRLNRLKSIVHAAMTDRRGLPTVHIDGRE